MPKRHSIYSVSCNVENHDPADLLAAVRRGVESGTIEGWLAEAEITPAGCIDAYFSVRTSPDPDGFGRPGTYLLIPVSDGGSET